MKTRDVFGYSFSAIRLRKLRAGLTTLGVVIGIAAIVALLSITTGLQNTITAQLNPPFEDARRLLESSLIEWGRSVLEVTLGYSSGVPNGTVLQKYEGIILKPSISLGIEASVTLNAQGVGGFAAATSTSTKVWTKTDPLTVLKAIFEKTLDVDISKLEDADAKTFLTTKQNSISQSGYSNWYFAQILAKAAGCWGFEVGKKFQLVSKNTAHGAEPKWKFRMFDFPTGELGGGKDGVYPILGFSTPTMAVFLAGAAKALRAMGTSSKDRKTVTLVANDAKSNVQSSGKAGVGIKDQQPADGEEEMLPIDAATKKENGIDAKSILEAEYKTARDTMGITIEVETLGMPDLLPGHLIEVKGVAKGRLDGPYVILDLEHSIGSGGFTTKFKAVTNTARFTKSEAAEFAPKQPNAKTLNEKNPDAKMGPKGGTLKVEPVKIDTSGIELAVERFAKFGF